MADDNGLGYITELRLTDVLFGRGSGPNDHEGNIRFRQLVAERKDEYLATNHRQTKATIAREIVNTILNDGGRFLKKVENMDARRLAIPKGIDAWIAVDDDTVMEKAKQALRQNTNKAPGGRGTSPNRGANSPLRGNSPVRGNVSPVRGHVSPVPGGVSPHPPSNTSPIPQHHQQQPQRRHPMPTFDDLEPLPLSMNNAARVAAQQPHHHQNPYVEMALQQQQLQQQVAQQQQQQQQQPPRLDDLEPTPLRWASNNNHNQFTTQTAPLGSGGANWGAEDGARFVVPSQSNSGLDPTPIWGGSAHGRLQDTAETMGPPQPRMRHSHNDAQQVDVNNWGTNSEHTVQTRHAGVKNEGEERLSMEEMRKRRQSLNVEDLMDSFSNLKASGDFSVDAKNQESTDTMGTIEPIGAYDSTNMSVTSFSSSTFSMFKDTMGQSTESLPFSRGISRNSSSNDPQLPSDAQRSGTGASAADMMSMQSLNSLNSIGNLSDVWGSRRASLLDRLVQEERERAGTQGSAGDGLAEAPRPIGLMEEDPGGNMPSFGASSLSVMKAAFDSNRATSAGNNSGTGQNNDGSQGSG